MLISFLSGGEEEEDVNDSIIDAYDWTVRLQETLSFEFDHGKDTKYNCCGIVGCLSRDVEEQGKDGEDDVNNKSSKSCTSCLTSVKYVSVPV